MNEKRMKDNKIPSPLVSLLPVFVLILLLFVTIRTFGSDALSGGSQVCLLLFLIPPLLLLPHLKRSLISRKYDDIE